MASRRWLLPTLVLLPLVAVAIIDVVRTATRPPFADLRLLAESPEMIFDPTAIVIDLADESRAADQPHTDSPIELGSGWGQATANGQWTAGPRAELVVTNGVGGQGALFLEGRVDRNRPGPGRIAIFINGTSVGGLDLSRGLSVRSLSLPKHLIRVGTNHLALELFDPTSGRLAADRTALIKRLALSADDSAGLPTPMDNPLRVAGEDELVVVREEGRLVLPFRVPVSGSELRFHYRFRDPKPGARCDVTVARRYDGPERFDIVRQVTLKSTERPAGRIRQPLHDRGEPCALVLRVNGAAAAGGFIVEKARVVVRP